MNDKTKDEMIKLLSFEYSNTKVWWIRHTSTHKQQSDKAVSLDIINDFSKFIDYRYQTRFS